MNQSIFRGQRMERLHATAAALSHDGSQLVMESRQGSSENSPESNQRAFAGQPTLLGLPAPDIQSYIERRLPIRASKENLMVVDWRLTVHRVAGHPVGSEKELGEKLLPKPIHSALHIDIELSSVVTELL
jgi:hypothetical protein